jgi:hypothetical protein
MSERKYISPEPEYATVHEYCKLRNLDLDANRRLTLGRRAARQSDLRSIPTTRRRASPINPGKMTTGYPVSLLDEVLEGMIQ